MTTIAQARQAIALHARLDALTTAQTALAAVQADGIASIVLQIQTPSYARPDGSAAVAGLNLQASVPVATVAQILSAELAAVQAAFNALGVTP